MSVHEDQIVRLGPDGYAAARLLLGRAFCDYNLMVYCQSDDARRLTAATTIYGALMMDCVYNGQVHAAPDCHGVACWHPPGVGGAGFWRDVRSGMLAVPFRLGLAGFRRLLPYGEAGKRLHHEHAPMPHWHLSVIAVDPEHQGRGIASRLMQPMLDRADAERLHCYLDTHQDRNVRLYERHGFEVAERFEPPGHPLPVYAMLRRPR
jgi:ribosomal protein S18 acetylase RimI-like enzyme